jgi:hypothetical protein
LYGEEDFQVFRDLAWDSEHFGLRIGGVTQRGPDIPARAVKQASAMGIDCLYLLVDAADVETLRSTAEAGFRMVDVRVTLSAEARRATDQIRMRVVHPDEMQRAGFRSALGNRIERTHKIAMALDWIFVRGPFVLEEGAVQRTAIGVGSIIQ